MVFAIVLTMPFLSLLSGAMTEKTLYADMPVEWAVSYDPRTDASDLVPESDNKALPFFSDGADTPYTFYTFLNVNQRAVYNTVKEKLFESSIDVALPSPLTWDGTSTSVPSNPVRCGHGRIIGTLRRLPDDFLDKRVQHKLRVFLLSNKQRVSLYDFIGYGEAANKHKCLCRYEQGKAGL